MYHNPAPEVCFYLFKHLYVYQLLPLSPPKAFRNKAVIPLLLVCERFVSGPCLGAISILHVTSILLGRRERELVALFELCCDYFLCRQFVIMSLPCQTHFTFRFLLCDNSNEHDHHWRIYSTI